MLVESDLINGCQIFDFSGAIAEAVHTANLPMALGVAAAPTYNKLRSRLPN
ncbi:MAG TPA: hypothetical protein IGS53_19460 [Leptolyngbyaceae cyanobacterium M33_DOE_097]|nr:hypothetical protein [Leptolyngbyaceae cyanobacterium M33_DOE_097]